MNLPPYSPDADAPPMADLVEACNTLIQEQRAWLLEFGPDAPANKRHGSMSIEQHQNKLNALMWLRRGYATALERQQARAAG